MNILYILQQSIYTNSDPPKWRTADSNIQMMRGILDQLTIHTDWKFYVLIAPLSNFDDITEYKTLVDHPNVTFIPYYFPVNAFWNRQHFDILEFNSIWKFLPTIDIVWNNITELSRNIKTYLFFEKSKAKLITCCYWLDCPELGQEKVDTAISYDWRQIDGFECSDLAVFTCDSTRDAFWKNSRKKINIGFVDSIMEKSTVWDFGYSQKELDSYDAPSYKIPTIAFLNRMSGINYTHHLEFIDAINMLAKKRKDFQVIFTNPSKKIPWQWIKDNVKNLHVPTEDFSRQDYLDLLHSADITVHLFEKELYGGCAHRESLHCKNIVVTPNVAEYARIQGSAYPFYTKITPEDLCRVLEKALDSFQTHKGISETFCYKGTSEFKEILERNRQSSYEVVKDQVIKDINNL